MEYTFFYTPCIFTTASGVTSKLCIDFRHKRSIGCSTAGLRIRVYIPLGVPGCPKLDVAEVNFGYCKTTFAVTRFPQMFKEISEVKVNVLPLNPLNVLKRIGKYAFSSRVS